MSDTKRWRIRIETSYGRPTWFFRPEWATKSAVNVTAAVDDAYVASRETIDATAEWLLKASRFTHRQIIVEEAI